MFLTIASVEVIINPKGAMGRYDVNVSPAQVSAMDTDPAFEPMEISIPSMKGVVQFINDKVFKSSGMVWRTRSSNRTTFGEQDENYQITTSTSY